MFLKAYEYSKINPRLNFLFIDLPIHKEIEYFYNFFFHDSKNKPIDKNNINYLLSYLQLNKLYEQFFWLLKDLNGQCPVCDPNLNLEKAYESLEKIMENYLVNLNDNIKIRNLSDKIINAMDQFDEEKILVFVKENSFLSVVNELLKDLGSYEEDKDLSDLNLGKYSILENLRNKNKDLYNQINGKNYKNNAIY